MEREESAGDGNNSRTIQRATLSRADAALLQKEREVSTVKPSAQIRGAEQALKKLTDLPKQMRFAASQALNDTAKDIQKFTVDELLPERFTLRSKGAPWFRPGNRFGFNIKFSNKENLTSVIGSQADWLGLQEKGGIKKAAGHRIAIPTDFWKKREEIMSSNKKPRAILLKKLGEDLNKAQANVTRIKSEIKDSERPFALKARLNRTKAKQELRAEKRKLRVARASIKAVQSTLNKPFEAKLKNGKEGIFVRTGQGRGSFRALFWYTDDARIDAALDFERTGAVIVSTNYQKHFEKRFTISVINAK